MPIAAAGCGVIYTTSVENDNNNGTCKLKVEIGAHDAQSPREQGSLTDNGDGPMRRLAAKGAIG